MLTVEKGLHDRVSGGSLLQQLMDLGLVDAPGALDVVAQQRFDYLDGG